MIILEDTRQADKKHILKEASIIMAGHEIRRTKLYVGDYTLPTDSSVCIDTKASIYELENNIIGKQHERFRNECLRAQEAGIKLIILVENEEEWLGREGNIYNPPVNCINDLYKWKNKRAFIWRDGKQKYPKATKGSTLAKACKTMNYKYGVEFLFCRPKQAGQIIINILTNVANEKKKEDEE